MTANAICARETNERLSAGTSFAKFVSHPTKRSAGRISFLKPPAFQFYADDFLAGTIGMSNEERGLYITLLCIQWNRGGVSEEDFERHGKGIAIASQSHVKSKFVLCERDGQFRNKRLELERRKQSEHRKRRVTAGTIGAKARWQSHSNRNATAIANDSSPSPSPSPIKYVHKGGAFKKPTREELDFHALKIGLAPTEVDKFVNHYESNGWRVGKNQMRSWPHALVNWKLNAQSYGSNRTNSRPDHNAGIVGHTPGRAERIIAERKAIEAAAKAAGDNMAAQVVGS